MSAPVLHTARLTLRPHRAEDFGPFAQALAQPEARYMGGPFDRRTAWAIFGADTGSWDLLGHGAWAVDRSGDGAHVGQIGLNRPAHFPERELGWLIYRPHRGRGYAREAARAALDHAFGVLGWQTAVSYVDPGNAASIRVAEALGAQRDHDAARTDPDDIVFRHPVPATRPVGAPAAALPHEAPPAGPGAALARRMQALVPVLRTARLVLRAPRLEDFPLLAEIAMSDRGAGIGGPLGRTETWGEFVQLTATWLLRGHGAWTITRDDAPVGFVLIGFEPGDREPELGFLVARQAEGQGIAHEAAQAVLAHAREVLAMRSLVSYVARDNRRSAALARRLGAVRDPAAEAALNPPDRHDTHVYRHDLTAGAAQ